MNLKKIYLLAKQASEGIDEIKSGSLGTNGFGFVFRNLKDLIIFSDESQKSSQICCLRDFRNFVENSESDVSKTISELKSEEIEDIVISSRIKTLVPSVEYGGYEILFEILIFILTPSQNFFPLTLYYGASGMALGGFDRDFNLNLFNFNPFQMKNADFNMLINALLLALHKVPTSDFYGIYRHDLGNSLIGLKGKRPIQMELDNIDPNFVSYLFDFL